MHRIGFNSCMFLQEISCLNIYMLQAAENTEYFKQPDHQNDHYNSIKNVFNGALHGNISIHQPEKNSGTNQNDNNSQNRHDNYVLSLVTLLLCIKVILVLHRSVI